MSSTIASAVHAALVAAALAGGALAQSVVPPLPVTGPHPVACTNVEQDLSRLAPAETADMYWNGLATDDKERYVDALLVSPANALVGTFVAPGDGELYDRWAGRTLEYVHLACYPTTAQNTRADYALPGGIVVPRMQRGAEAPILPGSPARLPVLLLSHGYGGSPLSSSYLAAVKSFASWGFVVLAPFHGDLRYSVLGPDEPPPQDDLYVPVWSEFVAMQATRPLSASNGLDVLFAHPQWRDRVDAQRIGAFGISQGGETLLLLGGAQLTYALLTLDSKPVTRDDRIKAAVGYVPYFGLDSLPAFGRDQAGAQGLTLPYLAMSGTADPIAPHAVTRRALDRMAGVRGHVLFDGLGHELDPTSAEDIVTWSQGFLAAFLLGDAAARSKLQQVQSVDGGLADRKSMYVDPSGGGGGGGGGTDGVVVDVIEYYNAGLDHYFITAFPEEMSALDAGTDWTRTGYAFKAWKAGTGTGNDACRFWGDAQASHFYTIYAAECAGLQDSADWIFEARAFRAVEPLTSGCASGYAAVQRLYNNGIGGTANHRYLTDATAIDRMIAAGWVLEGTAFCTPS